MPRSPLPARVRTVNGGPSALRAVVRFVILAVGYVIVFLGVASVSGLALKLLGSCLLFLILFHLALLGHDAGHGNLTRSPVLNRWLGRFAFLASYAPFSSWLASHNALHHAYTNLRGKDPMWSPMSKAEYDALSPLGRAMERFGRTLPGMLLANLRMAHATLAFPGPTVLAHIPRRWVFRLECWAARGWLMAQVVGVLAWQSMLETAFEIPAEAISSLGATVLLPFLLLNWWTGLLSFLHHTHPRVRWYADLAQWREAHAGIKCTVHLIAPAWLDWLFGNSLEHTAHHVAPKAPDNELTEIQHQLEETYPDFIQRVRLTDCLAILACCKLYDFDNHRWLGYDGKPVNAEQA